MNKIIILNILFYIFNNISLLYSQECSKYFNQSDTLVLKVYKFEKKQGYVRIGIYNIPENFLIDEQEKQYKRIKYPVNSDTVFIKLWMNYGTYAISVFHDENSNEIIDKNIFGYPTEPFSFSNKPKFLFKPPNFEQCKFYFCPYSKLKELVFY